MAEYTELQENVIAGEEDKVKASVRKGIKKINSGPSEDCAFLQTILDLTR